eukprot:jgi/Bigna1/141012/aug1.59_g15720
MRAQAGWELSSLLRGGEGLSLECKTAETERKGAEKRIMEEITRGGFRRKAKGRKEKKKRRKEKKGGRSVGRHIREVGAESILKNDRKRHAMLRFESRLSRPPQD